MLVFAFKSEVKHRGPLILVMVLERENLDRMKHGDPFDVQIGKHCPYLPAGMPIAALDIVIAYEEDSAKIADFHKRRDLAGLMEWLQRGHKIEGDDCTPPVRCD